MSQWQEMYTNKLRTPVEAVKVVKDGDWVDYGMATSQPILLDEALANRKDELKDIKVRASFSFAPRQVVEKDRNRETFTMANWHLSGYDRKLSAQGITNFIPMMYRNEPILYERYLDVDVAMITVGPMDNNGYFNFGLNVSANEAITDKAKIVIVEVNDVMPRVLGGRGEAIHISDVDLIVEAGSCPLPTIPFVLGDDVDKTIAKLVVDEIPNGATIQLGVGGLPNTVGAMIAESDLKDLGMHTEMMVDAFYLMYKNGKLTNKKKAIDKCKATWSFAVGTQEMYDWMDDNPFLAAYPVSYINDPCVIQQLDNFISINNCINVDMFGQVSSESSGFKQISGSGGQLDFADGAFRSKGGKSFICFKSTHMDKKTGKVASTIVPTFAAGTTITDPRSQVHWLVTEWGKVNMAGLSTWQRAEALVSLAHPDFRDDLIKAAEDMKIWRYSNKR